MTTLKNNNQAGLEVDADVLTGVDEIRESLIPNPSHPKRIESAKLDSVHRSIRRDLMRRAVRSTLKIG